MARKATAPGSDRPKEKSSFSFKTLLSTPRQIFFFSFFVFWCVIDVVLLGLVAEQIHGHERDASAWPSAKYQHTMGLLLFATIFSLIIGIFHAWLNLFLFLVIFVATGVFFGTGAGIIESTPFGHGLQCSNPVDRFPIQWQPEVHWCSRVTAINGLAWTMFGLAVIGLFWTIFDKYSFTSKRNAIYDPELAQTVEKAEH